MIFDTDITWCVTPQHAPNKAIDLCTQCTRNIACHPDKSHPWVSVSTFEPTSPTTCDWYRQPYKEQPPRHAPIPTP